MDFAGIFEKAQGDGMDRGVSPSLVEETSSPIQLGEIVLVRLAAPEFHVGDFEIAPEMAG